MASVLVRYGSRFYEKNTENGQKSTVRCAVDLNGPSRKTVRYGHGRRITSEPLLYLITCQFSVILLVFPRHKTRKDWQNTSQVRFAILILSQAVPIIASLDFSIILQFCQVSVLKIDKFSTETKKGISLYEAIC